MKAQKRKVLTEMLKDQKAVCLDQLTDDEKSWLNERTYEAQGDIIRLITTSPNESKQAEQITDKIGAKVTVIQVSSEATRQNLKKLISE
jgi:uncharacterized protein (DUF927 family)